MNIFIHQTLDSLLKWQCVIMPFYQVRPPKRLRSKQPPKLMQKREENRAAADAPVFSVTAVSVGFLSAFLFGVLGLSFMISIVPLWYFLPTASRAEWSCGRGWNATASSGTWKMFILNSGMDVLSPPVSSRPEGCPILPAPQLSSAPPVPCPRRSLLLLWTSQKCTANFVLCLNTARSQCDMVHLWARFL